MGDSTSISWTDATWNVTRGCRRVSAGCENCYAERQANRFKGPGGAYEGLIKLVGGKPRWSGATKFATEHLADPLRWKSPRRIFVDSMSDLFYEGFTNEQIAAVFGVMAACPQHTFQVLTKRAKRMREWFEWMSLAERILDAEWPLPNVWLGVSVENQAAADERIPELLQTPAAVRFLSCEPLIGPVDLAAARERAEKWLDDATTRDNAINEQVMALDVRDLVEEVIELRQGLDLAYGPHCSSCGNPIDPDCCHCGEDHKDSYGDAGHAFCPMGCMCGYEPNWQWLAKSRGDLVGKLRRELGEMTKARDEACDLANQLGLCSCGCGNRVADPPSRVTDLRAVGEEQS